MKNPGNYQQPFTNMSAAENLYDLSMLEEIDDSEYVLEVLNIFLSEAPKEFEEMEYALQHNQAKAVCQIAHKLKGSAGVIGANKFAILLGSIETLGKKDFVTSELVCMAEHARCQYHRIENALDLYMADLNRFSQAVKHL